MIAYYIHSTAPIDKFNLFPNTLVINDNDEEVVTELE